MTLDERAIGRKNNLNLIRLIAAWAVLASHSYVLATGDLQAEPWQKLLGTAPGGIAVDIFFVVSGFLVAGSLLRSTSVWEFAFSRALRIYPALWIALSWTVASVGTWFSSEPMSDYLGDVQTWKYLLKNSLMITGAEADLPGAFADNAAPSAINGSLWTLRHELRLYFLLALGWLAIIRATRSRSRRLWLERASLATASLLVIFCIYLAQQGTPPIVPRLGAMFFSGVAYQVFRKNIKLSPVLCTGAVLALVAGAVDAPENFQTTYYFCLPYLTLFFAYWPRNETLLRFNRIGDYSYGIYIYAFPIQQMIMATAPDLSIWNLTLRATLATVIFAVVSWHFIEKPAMSRKHDLLAGLTPILGLKNLKLPHESEIRKEHR